MKNNKLPGNDGFPKEFYETFWASLAEPFLNSIKTSELWNELSSSQREAVIRLIIKKDKDKSFIENWRPISLLNVDSELISKTLALRLKTVLTSLISPTQIAYVKNRFVSESGRLISNIMDVSGQMEMTFTLHMEMMFIRNKNSVIELLSDFDIFSVIYGLKANKSKCKTAGIWNLKGVYVALCHLKCITWMNENVKIFGYHFSYNKTLQQENNFKKPISKIENVLKAWRMRHLTLEGKIMFSNLFLFQRLYILH